MRLYIIALFAFVLLFLLSACMIPVSKMQETFPQMYQNPPSAVLILPPINNSTAVEAKEYFACSLAEAVGRKGYYTMPVEAMFNVLREEGLYQTEVLDLTNLSNLRKYFGAEAVLVTTIERWDKTWFLTTGTLHIDAKFALLSTATADTLWDFSAKTRVRMESSSDNLLGAALESALKTVFEDYFPNSLKANKATMDTSLPYGKHHPEFGKDAENAISPFKVISLEINK